MNQPRGFITIATGDEEYYFLAANLLKSYRYFAGERLPFGILCDRRNKYTELFDDVIVFPDGASNSYLDKLRMGELLPYEETIFIDADCLAYGDLNNLFSCFKDAGDFSCFGRTLSLDDETGWFEYKNLGTLQNKVSFVIGLHGGIYYMRKSEKMKAVFKTARSLIPEYKRFQFKGNFDTPGDEPLIALSMALNQIKPTDFKEGTICCFWDCQNNMKIDISIPIACEKGTTQNIFLMHWGTRFTRLLLYKEQIELLNIMIEGKNVFLRVQLCRLVYRVKVLCENMNKFKGRVNNKIIRICNSRKEK